MGKTGRAMIAAIIADETNPVKLAALADPRVKSSQQDLRRALHGRVRKHHRFLLRLHLQQIDSSDAAIAQIDREVDANLASFRIAIELLTSIPGVALLAAQIIVSEIGMDMTRFVTPAHLISWAGLCPRNDESAGKRRSTRLRTGAPWLKTTLIQCACAAIRKKEELPASPVPPSAGSSRCKEGNLCRGGFHSHRRLYKLKDGTSYHDLGPNHFFPPRFQRKANPASA
jgi:transposase